MDPDAHSWSEDDSGLLGGLMQDAELQQWARSVYAAVHAADEVPHHAVVEVNPGRYGLVYTGPARGLAALANSLRAAGAEVEYEPPFERRGAGPTDVTVTITVHATSVDHVKGGAGPGLR